MGSLQCAHCGRVVPANPHIKNQTHCKREACQRDTKRLWQRQKMATDPDYKANQRECNKAWQERNPQYWKEYRKNHPEAAERNRIQQRERNRRRRKIAKMDTSVRKITLILMPYEDRARAFGGLQKRTQ